MTREQRIKKRYQAEKRFRMLGIGSIAIAIFFVFLLLFKVFSTGSTAFIKTTIQTEVDFNKELLELGEGEPITERQHEAPVFEQLGGLGDRILGGAGIEPEFHGSEALKHGC